MSDRKWICTDKSRLREFFDVLYTGWDWSKPLQISYCEHQEKRSLSANALYWVWLGHMAKHFSSKRGNHTNDQMHDLMRHMFLGYEVVVIGNTKLKDRLKSTKGLPIMEFCFYMEQIDAWAADKGCLLPRQEDNEYTKYKEAQQ